MSTKSVKKVRESGFSTFIRHASAAEKKRVYTEVLEKASKRQNEIVKKSLCGGGKPD